MNREFNATSKFARSIIVVAAALSTALVIGSIDSLAQHYSAELQVTAAPTIVMARQ
jgi:hypothetical protein